jgi:cytoskeletal protein RodZ
MSRSVLLGLIVVTLALLTWLFYGSLQRPRALASEVITLPETSSTSTTESVSEPSTVTTESLSSEVSTPATSNTETISSSEVASSNTSPALDPSYGNQPISELPSVKEETPVLASDEPPSTPETAETTSSCSSFDEAGLLAAFDSALAVFIADATATYGDQYENLQYQLSGPSSVIEEAQGIVTTTYSGTVQDRVTGEAISAGGTIHATFSWDGCAWQVVDYSF